MKFQDVTQSRSTTASRPRARVMTYTKKKSKHFTFRSDLRCDARTFIDDKDTDAYRAFHMKRVGTRELEIMSDILDPESGERTIVIRTVPGIKLPKLLHGFVPNGKVEFIDTRTFADGSEHEVPFAQDFTTVNNITKHSVVRGTITIRATGENTCAVDVVGECQVALRGVGGLIENIVVDGIRKSYESLPAIVDEWMEHKKTIIDTNRKSSVSEEKPRDMGFGFRIPKTVSVDSFHSACEDARSPSIVLRDEAKAKESVLVKSRPRARTFLVCCVSKPQVGDVEEFTDAEKNLNQPSARKSFERTNTVFYSCRDLSESS